MKSFGKFIANNRFFVIIIALILLIPSIIGMNSTKINYDLLTYLPHNLDSMKGQDVLDKTFSNAATSFLILDNKQPNDVLKLKNKISDVAGVDKVIGESDLVDPSVPQNILPDDIKKVFYSKNSTLLFIKFTDSSASESTQNAIDKIRTITGKQCYLSGMSAIDKDTMDVADREAPMYVLLAVIFSAVLLSLIMKSVLIPFIFLAGIGMAVVYNMGTNIFLGNISYITKSIAAVLQLGVTMDFSIFLYHRYEEEKQKYADIKEAMAEAISKTIVPIGSSCLTATAGFMAMCAMNLSLGKDIGIVMAKGVVLGFLSVITILPSLLLIFDKPITRYNHKTIMPSFEKTADFLTKHYKLIIVLFIAAFIPAVIGRQNLKVYYNLDRSLPKNLPSIVATNKLKNDYNMMTTHFIVYSSKMPYYKEKDMTDRIDSVKGITSVLSLNKYIGPGIPANFLPVSLTSNFEKDGYKVILLNSTYKTATTALNNQLGELNGIIKQYDPKAMITGEGALTKDLTQIANKDFVRVDMYSIGMVVLILLAVFTSLSIPIILVLAIELAIFINMSISFYMGVTVPFVASIVIGCIQLGSCVNYAILMTTRYREELKSYPKLEAIKIAIKESSKSIMASALSFFSATIGVSIISGLEMIKSLCTMMARGAIISMIITIFVLPCLLYVLEGPISATTINWSKKHKRLAIKGGTNYEN